MSCNISDEVIVKLIEDGDPLGADLLVEKFRRGMLCLARHHAPENADDIVQDVILQVIRQVGAGMLKNATALTCYIRTIMHRHFSRNNAHYLGSVTRPFELEDLYPDKSSNDPFVKYVLKERVEIMRKHMKTLSSRDQEILYRFYLLGQPASKIMQDLHMTDTSFRLVKSRSKAKLGEAVRKAGCWASGIVSFNAMTMMN